MTENLMNQPAENSANRSADDSATRSADNAASQFLGENEHVKELTEILKTYGLSSDAQGLSEVVSHITSMEKELTKALGELTAMRRELSSIKEGQDHPIRNLLQKTADSLTKQLKSLLERIKVIKDKIIGSCKQAVEDIKDKGIVAASGVVGALHVKDNLEAARVSIKDSIGYCEKQIAKIEAASTELHTAGLHIRNFGRAIMGKEPVHDIKPNGRFAKLLQAPFRSEIKSCNRALERNEKALTRIEKLERAAEVAADKSKPSVVDEIKRHKSAAQTTPDAPRPVKVKMAQQEI